MDLVQIAVSVAQNPFGLLLFLLVVVYWSAVMIKRKDDDIKEMHQQMIQHYEKDSKESEKRETWYQGNIEWSQNFLDTLLEQVTNIDNNVHDIESLLQKYLALQAGGGAHFERSESSRVDEVSSTTNINDTGMHHLRRKLSAGRETK